MLFFEAPRFSFHSCLALEVYEKIRMVIENKAAMLGFILFGQSALSEREILTLLQFNGKSNPASVRWSPDKNFSASHLLGRWFQETPGGKWDREVQETTQV